jgi:hypothetical protein
MLVPKMLFARKRVHRDFLNCVFRASYRNSIRWQLAGGIGERYRAISRLANTQIGVRLFWLHDRDEGRQEKLLTAVTIAKIRLLFDFGTPNCELVLQSLAAGGIPIADTTPATAGMVRIMRRQAHQLSEKQIASRLRRWQQRVNETLLLLHGAATSGNLQLRRITTDPTRYLGSLGSHEVAIDFFSPMVSDTERVKNAYVILRIDGCIVQFGAGTDGMYLVCEIVSLYDSKARAALDREISVTQELVASMRSELLAEAK